jgi:sulfur-carrier protein
MILEVRLFATLRENRGKVLKLEVASGVTGAEIIASLDIIKEDVAIFLINGRDGVLETPLVEGDVLSIFPPVGGG